MTEGGSPRRTFLKGVATGTLGVGLAGAAYTQRDLVLQGDGSVDTATGVRTLVPQSRVTHAASGGDWSLDSTWSDGVPGDGARVQVPEGTTVTVDEALDTRLWTVRVDGRLRFDPSTVTRLAVDTLVVTGTGRLEIGTGEDPVTERATVEFLDRGPIDESWDPERVSRGLIALPGATVRIHGTERTPHSAVADPPRVGDRSLTLPSAPTGWESGDRLVLAGVDPDQNRDEELIVEAIEGSTVRLGEALAEDHVPPRDSLHTRVAHLDRSVRLRSESTATKRRGHVMFMTDDVAVADAGFYELGRTDKSRPITNPTNGRPPSPDTPNPKARYACHFHRTGIVDTDPQVVTRSVVWGSPGWGFVNHHSHVDFVENVSYQVFGAGFVAEVGNEVGTFRRNFALRSAGTGRLPDNRQFRQGKEDAIDDFGHGGYGFWLQSPGVAVEGNVAAGHRHFGFVWWLRPKPDRQMDPDRFAGITIEFANFPVENLDGQQRLREVDAATDGMVPSTLVAIRSFVDNTVFASGGGVDVSRHRFGDAHENTDAYSVVEEFTAFNIGSLYSPWDSLRVPNSGGGQGGENGVSVRYSANVVCKGLTLVSGVGGHRGVAVNRNHAPTNVRIEDADVEGWYTGIRAMARGTSPIERARLDNEIDVHAVGGGLDRRWSPPQRIPLTDVTFGEGGRANLFLGTDLDRDLYGALAPEGGVRLDGQELYFASQRPEFVPFPLPADLSAFDGDALGDLSEVNPKALAGESNADLFEEYGLAVEGEPLPADAGRRAGVENGFVAGGTDRGDGSGPIRQVTPVLGSVFELGRLGQGERLYVYDESTFLAVPGTYAGLPYVRPEREDAGVDRTTGYHLDLAAPAVLFVAYDTESRPRWLRQWTDTGDTLGTEDGTRRVYRRPASAGGTWLGSCPDTHRMYTVFVRRA